MKGSFMHVGPSGILIEDDPQDTTIPRFMSVPKPLNPIQLFSAITQLQTGESGEPIQRVEEIKSVLDLLSLPLIFKYQRALTTLEGGSWPTFEENQRIATAIQDLAERFRCAFVCPRPGCGRPSKLRCKKPKNSKTGTFQFEHYVDDPIEETKAKRTTHGASSSLPTLVLVPLDRELAQLVKKVTSSELFSLGS